jgi:hypothetical protein
VATLRLFWLARKIRRRRGNQMAQDIVGSKIKTFPSEELQHSQRGYGQNGSAVSPSQKPGEVRAISKQMADVSPPEVSADPGTWQTRNVAPEAMATHPGIRGATKAALPGQVQSPRPSSVKVGTPARTNAMPGKGGPFLRPQALSRVVDN